MYSSVAAQILEKKAKLHVRIICLRYIKKDVVYAIHILYFACIYVVQHIRSDPIIDTTYKPILAGLESMS